MIAAYKRPPETARGNWVRSDYFETEWRDAQTTFEAHLAKLPVALNLESLYGQLIRALMPYPARENETLQEQAERIAAVKNQEKTCQRLESKVSRETQFNRRVSLNAEYRSAQSVLNELIK